MPKTSTGCAGKAVWWQNRCRQASREPDHGIHQRSLCLLVVKAVLNEHSCHWAASTVWLGFNYHALRGSFDDRADFSPSACRVITSSSESIPSPVIAETFMN